MKNYFIGLLILAGFWHNGVYGQTRLRDKLTELKPLPKIHYSFGLRESVLNNDDGRLYELARITHSLCFQAVTVTEKQFQLCYDNCARVNKTEPAIKSSLGVNYSPWHQRFGKDLPPTDKGETYKNELDLYRQRMTLIKQWLENANTKSGGDIKITAILLDSERFSPKPGNSEWNQAIREKLNDIAAITRELYPDADIEWYSRGTVTEWDAQISGNPLCQKEDTLGSLSLSFYAVPELNRMNGCYRKMVELADNRGIPYVTPWVALGCGFRRGLIKTFYWDFNWDYDLIYSYEVGAELNIPWYGQNPERYAPFNRGKVVVFYPSPFDDRVPSWEKHFIAYVRGATEIKYLDDFGFKN